MKSDWDVLVAYVAGEVPEAERPRIERWIREDPERERVLAELRLLWETRAAVPDVDAAWARLSARLEEAPAAVMEGDEVSGVVPMRPRVAAPPRPWRAWLLRAAILAAALLGGLAVFDRVARQADAPEAVWAAARPYTTERGELARIRLADGTEVVLGVRSRLLVRADFATGPREVRLEGEAFFDVAEDAERPFSVHAEHATIRVLGTEFGARARGDGETSVVVSSGRVRLEAGAAAAGSDGAAPVPAAELGPGQLGRLAAGMPHVAVDDVDPATHLAWMERRLVFENAPLAEVLEQLALWYDVEFRIDDAELAALRLNASFERAPVAEVLHGIALATNATYVVEGRTVTFVTRR